jgi:hypothetical protein
LAFLNRISKVYTRAKNPSRNWFSAGRRRAGYKGDDFIGGFGRQILGETWVGHYGPNHTSSTRLDIVPGKETHPVLTGVKAPWSEIGAYNAAPAMAQPLAGMTPTSPNDPTKKPMPGAWVRTYKSESGKSGRVFASTYGGSGDLVNDGFRRMLVTPDLDATIVGPYRPTWMGVNKRSRQRP